MGGDRHFGKASALAFEVYSFADRMQLKVLIAAVVKHFANSEPRTCVLACYEFFKNIHYDAQQLSKIELVNIFFLPHNRNISILYRREILYLTKYYNGAGMSYFLFLYYIKTQ